MRTDSTSFFFLMVGLLTTTPALPQVAPFTPSPPAAADTQDPGDPLYREARTIRLKVGKKGA